MIRELLERIDRIDLSILETVVIGRLRIYRGTVKSPFVVLLVLNVIWGLNPVAIRRVGFELSPVNLTLARWLIASAGLLLIAPFLFRRRRFSFKKRDITALVIVSLANVAAYHLAINYAETIVSSSVAGLLLSFGPVFAVVLSTIYLKETVALTQYVALIVAILGTIALFAGLILDSRFPMSRGRWQLSSRHSCSVSSQSVRSRSWKSLEAYPQISW